MSYDSTILAESNLTAYYPLNETSGTVAHDLTVNAFNGTLHGTITLNQTKLDVGLDPCMLFDGSTGYISLPSGVQVVEPLSMEIWIQTGSSLPSGGIVLLSCKAPSIGYEYGIEGTPTQNSYIALNGGATNGGSVFSTNTVYYVAVTIDTSQNMTMYTAPVGGTVTQQITANPGGSLSYTVATFLAARNNSGSPSLPLNGNMSSVAFYTKLLSTTTMNNHITAAHTASNKFRIMDGYGGVFS